MTGKVYFVSAPGRIKIGFTRKPERRLTALRRADMEELSMIGIMAGERALEKKLHTLCNSYRLRGEWFKDCEEVREIINDALAGRHNVAIEPEGRSLIVTPNHDQEEDSEASYSPEFQIVARLLDEAQASVDRGDDKYEVRGRVGAALAAADVFIKQRQVSA